MENGSCKKDSRERKPKGKEENNEKMLRCRAKKKWNKERKRHLQGRQTEMSAGESLESCRKKKNTALTEKSRRWRPEITPAEKRMRNKIKQLQEGKQLAEKDPGQGKKNEGKEKPACRTQAITDGK